MAVAGFKIRVNGGAFTNEVIDIGFPAPVDGFVEYLQTGLEADTDYTFEAAAYDSWGNLAAWGTPYIYTTPEASLVWVNHIQAGWSIGSDQALTATSSSFTPYAPDVVPQFTNIGDYIEFEFPGGAAFGHIRLTDTASHSLYSYPSSQWDDESGFLVGLGAGYSYDDGDTIRIEKTSANRFSVSVNGNSLVELAKNMTGTVTAHVETLTVVGNIIAPPVTNIPF